jgi:predicted component of type VI protein secretion system
VRRIGRLRLRWEDDIRKDVGRNKIRNKSEMAIDRQALNGVFEQAKTYKELLSQVKKNLIVNSYIVPVTLSYMTMTLYEPKRVADSVVQNNKMYILINYR